MPSDDDDSDDHLWDLWADAHIVCEINGAARVLRGPDVQPLPAAAPILVVTAYNPNGIDRELAVNEAAERELEAELEAIGATHWGATGHSADWSWSEPGVAISGLERSDVCDLGRRYGQLGIFELTDEDVHVVRCADEAVVRTRSRELASSD